MVILKDYIPSTVKDLMSLSHDVKAELIDGEIVMMSPAAAKHSFVNSSLTHHLRDHCQKLRKKRQGGNGTGDNDWLIISEALVEYDDFNCFQHDLSGFLRKDLPQLPAKGAIQAKPTWVCETLSPSNKNRDIQDKKHVLEQHQVPYYWMVDPLHELIHVFEFKAQAYVLVRTVNKSEGLVKLAPFEDLELNLAEVFDPWA